jgi:hypothetical protein
MAAVSSAAGSVCRVALSRLESRDASANQEIIDALRTKNFFFVKLSSEQNATVQRCFSASKEFFTQTDLKTKNAFRVSSKLGYKKNTPKERFQFRQSGTQCRKLALFVFFFGDVPNFFFLHTRVTALYYFPSSSQKNEFLVQV